MGFVLQDQGFKPLLCPGKGLCPIVLYDAFKGEWLHPQWEGTSLEERQAIPPQISKGVGGAIGVFLNKLAEI